MKFGQDLDDHLVSEWRHQYLNYKKGKKKLKKLKKQANSVASSQHGTPLHGISHNVRATPSMPTNTPAAFQKNSIRTPQISQAKGSGVNDSRHSLSSFMLPSPALGQSNGSLSGPTNGSLERPKQSNDRTPLLHPIDGASPSDTRRRNTEFPTSSYAKEPSLKDTRRFSLPGDAFNDSIELDDLILISKQEFIDWVDSELEKVDSFYKEKEDECLNRFLLLQDQTAQLRDQYERSKRKYNAFMTITSGEGQQHHNAIEHVDDHDSDSESERDNDDEFFDTGSIYQKSQLTQLVKVYTFLTKRKFAILNKFDVPSLPTLSWFHGTGRTEKQYYEEGYSEDEDNEQNGGNSSHTDTETEADNARANRRDYERRRKPQVKHPRKIPYFQARRRLKAAIYEFYRSMELLKSYRLLNRTAFRKIIKKYDKTTKDQLLQTYMDKVDNSYFVKSNILENLIGSVEELFTNVFEHGNRKIAITKLRRKDDNETFYAEFFASGLMLGLSIILLIFTIYYALNRTLNGDLPEGKWLLQIWAGFLMVNLLALFFGVNCLIWDKVKVNYRFIFEFNTKDALSPQQFLVLPSLFLFGLSFFAWFSFADLWPTQFNGRDWPWFYFGMTVLIFFCPFDIFYLNSRIWLLSTIWRLLLSGLYPVEFRDFFMGDVFSSLTYSLGDIYTFFCLYGTHWKGCLDGSGNTPCGSSRSRFMGFLSTVPSIWRLLQCLRRYADTGDWFPHLANMLKYTCGIMYYMSLSLYRMDTVVRYKALLITFASINSIYTSIWDLLMDWSLFQFNSENFLLRDELAFKNVWVYYVAIVLNVILRFQWIFYALFSKEIQQSAVTSFCIGLAEVIRRSIWMIFRLENEHCTNVHLFRASREAPLPYPVTLRKQVAARRKTGVSLDTSTGKGDVETTDYRPTPQSESNIRNRKTSTLNMSAPMHNDTTLSIASIPSSIQSDADIETPQHYSPEVEMNEGTSQIPLPRYASDSNDAEQAPPSKDSPATSHTQHEPQLKPTLSRRQSMFVTPPKSQNVFENLSRVLTNAHIKDFQRRRPESSSKVVYTSHHHDGEPISSRRHTLGAGRSGSMSTVSRARDTEDDAGTTRFQTVYTAADDEDDDDDMDEEDDLDTDEDMAEERIGKMVSSSIRS